jgi:hypothetical protein
VHPNRSTGRLESQDLVQRGLVGDQPGLDQRLPRANHRRWVKGQAPGDGGIAIVAQALRVPDGDQEQVQRQRGRIAVLDVTVTDQALIDPAELGRRGALSARCLACSQLALTRAAFLQRPSASRRAASRGRYRARTRG